MPVEVIFEPGDPFVEARFVEPVTAAEFDRMARAADETGLSRRLMVMTDSHASRDTFTAFLASGIRGTRATSRIAVLDPSGFHEVDVVQLALGPTADLGYFTTRDEAVAWLLAEHSHGDSDAAIS